jgi:hypothetical protein
VRHTIDTGTLEDLASLAGGTKAVALDLHPQNQSTRSLR